MLARVWESGLAVLTSDSKLIVVTDLADPRPRRMADVPGMFAWAPQHRLKDASCREGCTWRMCSYLCISFDEVSLAARVGSERLCLFPRARACITRPLMCSRATGRCSSLIPNTPACPRSPSYSVSAGMSSIPTCMTVLRPQHTVSGQPELLLGVGDALYSVDFHTATKMVRSISPPFLLRAPVS